MNLKSYLRFTRYGLGIALVAVLALTLAGQPGAVAQGDLPTISGNIGDNAIEIDDLDDDPNTTPDANLEEGPNPATDPDLPFIVGATYIDWNDLAPAGPGEHVFFDPSGPTDDSFAGTSTRSCLQPAHSAPQKEDILRVYMADNGEYLYFGLADLSPSGDSRHVILFHKNPLQLGESCAGDGQQVRLQLTSDDKLIRATFKPSANEPASQVYSVVSPGSTMFIDEAANYSDGALWTPTAAVANFAVNLSDLNDELGGGVNVPAETFGEGAVALSDLGVPACGASYYVSIITRSSGSGGGEAKDFVGGVYNFPSIYITGSVTPSCQAEFGYSAQAYYDDAFTMPIPDGDVTYDWTCDGGVDPMGKSGTQSAAENMYNCSVTATLNEATSCNATESGLMVDVWDPLGVTVDAVPSCNLTDNAYSATISGGSDSGVSHAWSGTGVTFSDASAASGTFDVGAAGTYTLKDVVTDLRTDLPAGECTAEDTDSVALSELSATATLQDTCTLELPYSSTVSGDLGTVSYSWSFSGPTTVTPDMSSAASGTADVAAPGGANFTGDLTVTDLRTDNSDNSIGTYSCEATSSDTADVYGPISVSIAPDDTSLICPAVDTAGTDVTYTASASGGDGNYSYSWTIGGANTAAACGDSASCLVDSAPDDYCAIITAQVTVDDGFALCAAQDSEEEMVTKTTSVLATNN